MLKKVWIFTLLFSLQYCASSVSEKVSMAPSEIEPLDQLLIKKAVLPEQKKAVKDYLLQMNEL